MQEGEDGEVVRGAREPVFADADTDDDEDGVAVDSP